MSLKSAQTAKIGKQFKSMRESIGLSESQVSAKTYINVDYIKAIESGDYSIFPARMFALRYFERYSIFLGINQVFLIFMMPIIFLRAAKKSKKDRLRISILKLKLPHR